MMEYQDYSKTKIAEALALGDKDGFEEMNVVEVNKSVTWSGDFRKLGA